MCGRYSLAVPPEELEQIFSATADEDLHLPRWNIAPTQDAPVVVQEPARRRIRSLRWGLVPPWARDPRVAARHVNARSETASVRPAFREAFARRRCLVPADGFYEWVAGPRGRPRLPWWIHHGRGGVLAFAGLHERWGDLSTFTILTTTPNSVVAPVHDRMPAVLPPEEWDVWLDLDAEVADVLPLLRPAPAALLRARRVSTRVNRVENDDAGCVEPVEEPEPRDGSELLDLFEGR